MSNITSSINENERDASSSRYLAEENETFNDIAKILNMNYDIGKVKNIIRISNGYGSVPYYVLSEKGEYVLKDIDKSPMNNPENEALIIRELKENDIPVSEILPTTSGQFVLPFESKTYHLQKYVEGIIYSRNTAPEWLLYESARTLGKIQIAMEKLPSLPIGISQGFFDYMTPERAKLNYAASLELAIQKNDIEVVNAINGKVQMLNYCSNYKFDVSKMTCSNTHGDYKIQQIICGKNNINAVIDFTSACIHPICWEIIRSYSLADKQCSKGRIDIDNFMKYVSCFLERGHLNSYDLKIMPYVYFYQSLVSDHFGQYYAMESRNKHILLDDAFHLSKLCKWFEKNITRLEDALILGF